jgi:hypothetical protein
MLAGEQEQFLRHGHGQLHFRRKGDVVVGEDLHEPQFALGQAELGTQTDARTFTEGEERIFVQLF